MQKCYFIFMAHILHTLSWSIQKVSRMCPECEITNMYIAKNLKKLLLSNHLKVIKQIFELIWCTDIAVLIPSWEYIKNFPFQHPLCKIMARILKSVEKNWWNFCTDLTFDLLKIVLMRSNFKTIICCSSLVILWPHI